MNSSATTAKAEVSPVGGFNGGKAVASASGLSAVLIAGSKLLPSDYQEFATATAPFLSGIIIYFGVGFINKFGFEDAGVAQKRKRYKSDIKGMEKDLKKNGLPEDTKKMLQEKKHKTLELLYSMPLE